MRNRLTSLFTLECARLLLSPRWGVAMLVWLIVAWDAADPFERNAMLFGVTDWSGWDMHAAAIDSFFGIVLLMLPAFAIVACDGIASDRASRYAHVVVSRAGSRGAWWGAKAAAIVVAALVFHAGFLATCLGVAGLKGASLSPATTAAGRFDFDRTSGSDMEVEPTYPPVRRGDSMLAREILRVAYLGLAFGAIGILLAAFSVRVPYVWFPAAAAIALALADWSLNWFFKDAYFRLSPLTRLAEASHSAGFMERPFSWASSVALFGALAIAATALGRRWITRTDL